MRRAWEFTSYYPDNRVHNTAAEYSFQISQQSEKEEAYPLSLDEKVPKTDFRLFVGGISLHISLHELESRLKLSAGLTGDISISMVDRTDTNTFSGYGYITASNAEDQSRLLALKTFKYKRCWIGIKPFLTSKTDIRKLKSQKAERKLHIKGITQRIAEKDLERYFSQFGGINHIQINKSQSTGHYKGFAFIEFADKESVERVIANPMHSVKKVCLICERSKIKTPDLPLGYEQQEKDQYFGRTRNSLSFNRSVTFKSPLSYASFEKVASNHTITNINFNYCIGRSARGLPLDHQRPTQGGHQYQFPVESVIIPVSPKRV